MCLGKGTSVAFTKASVNAPKLYSLMESSDGKNRPGEHEGHLLCFSLRVKGQRSGQTFPLLRDLQWNAWLGDTTV